MHLIYPQNPMPMINACILSISVLAIAGIVKLQQLGAWYGVGAMRVECTAEDPTPNHKTLHPAL